MDDTLLGKLSEHLLLSKDKSDYLIRSAPYRYKVYKVPKRSRKGFRTIAQPSREVKRMQYWLLENIFHLFPIHESAIGYISGKNILHNVNPHTRNPFMLKLDFKDFFPSIKRHDFEEYTQSVANFTYSSTELEMLIRILFWKPKFNPVYQLSIGAPTSPSLSNAIMYNFDKSVSTFCIKHDIAYTRYADDMTFSMSDGALRFDVLKEVTGILGNLHYPKLQLNNQKIVFASKAHRRMVTGLIITNAGAVSLGREKKRLIRSKIYRFQKGELSEAEHEHLRGMLAFIRSVEPDFIKRMEQKYGSEVMKAI